MYKILVDITAKNGKRTRRVFHGDASVIHDCKSKSGIAVKYYAKHVRVIVDGQPVFWWSATHGLKVNISSKTF